jgi:hypothetical protein
MGIGKENPLSDSQMGRALHSEWGPTRTAEVRPVDGATGGEEKRAEFNLSVFGIVGERQKVKARRFYEYPPFCIGANTFLKHLAV